MADSLEEKRRQLVYKESALATWLSASFILGLGSLFAYGGFQVGLTRQIERGRTEFEQEGKPLNVDFNKVGPSGLTPKQLAMRAFSRGSAVATVVAIAAGFGLSSVVERYHTGVPKGQEEREMKDLYKVIGLNEDGSAEDVKQNGIAKAPSKKSF